MRILKLDYSNISWDAQTLVLFGIVTFHTYLGPIHVECSISEFSPSSESSPRRILLKVAKSKLRLPEPTNLQSTYDLLMRRAA